MAEKAETVTITIPQEPRELVGEVLGRHMRERLDLDAIDHSTSQALVRIGTPVVTVSFARGLIEPSVQALGYEGFTRKYAFDATSSVKTIIQSAARVAATGKSAA